MYEEGRRSKNMKFTANIAECDSFKQFDMEDTALRRASVGVARVSYTISFGRHRRRQTRTQFFTQTQTLTKIQT